MNEIIETKKPTLDERLSNIEESIALIANSLGMIAEQNLVIKRGTPGKAGEITIKVPLNRSNPQIRADIDKQFFFLDYVNEEYKKRSVKPDANDIRE